MRKNRWSLLAILILGTIALWFFAKDKKNTIKKELRDFAINDTSSITKIFLASKSGQQVLLEKKGVGHWELNGKYKARTDAVNLLLYTAKNIQVKSPVGKNAQANIIKRLASGAIKAEFYVNDELTKNYYIGDATQDQLGTYMLLTDPETGQNSSAPFIMYIPGFDGYLTPRYFTDESDWRNRNIFDHNPPLIKSVSIVLPEKDELSYTITQTDSNIYEIKLNKINRIIPNPDTVAIKQFLAYFQNINYEALYKESGRTLDSILTSSPMFIIQVTDKDNKSTTVKLFAKEASEEKVDIDGKPLKYDMDRLYAQINNNKELVIVQYYVFGKLLMEPDYFKYSTSKKH